MASERLSKGDPHSYSKPEEAILKGIHLRIELDFEKQIVFGNAYCTANVVKQGCSILTLDSKDLIIDKVCGDDNQDLVHKLHPSVAAFGSKLEIHLPSSECKQYDIKISYKTSPKSSALQWLTAAQTAGKQHPYMFSQCQAIHARSLLPCQDTPAVKITYSAEVIVRKPLVVVLSAVSDGKRDLPTDTDKHVYQFSQTVPIPSYLIAIACGALESRKVGAITDVWCEKEMVDAAAWEFAEVDKVVDIATQLMGRYVWGRYDILILPPSFNYGGMENPCMTFATPTIICGDRSMIELIAHEITHSWMGNLVTNCNGEHFWLNEGHTTFVERKIVSRLSGAASGHLNGLTRWRDLHYTVHDQIGVDHEHTKLVPNLTGIDPDEAFSVVPYEKGAALLSYIEGLLGGPDVFEPYLRSYIQKFQYQSIDTSQWKEYLYEYFSDKKSVLDGIEWERWLYGTGMPPVKPQYDERVIAECTALGERWRAASDGEDSAKHFSPADLDGMFPAQVIELLTMLQQQDPPLSAKKIEAMNELYKMNEKKNWEIKFRWLRLCLTSHYEAAVDWAIQFVTSQGRMKYVRPLYRDMYAWSESRERAVETFKRSRDQLHASAAHLIATRDLRLE